MLVTQYIGAMRAISIDEALAGSDSISQVRATSSGVYWLAKLSADDGRITIRRWVDGQTTEMTPKANVRSRVMEYGGGAYDAAENLVAYVDDADGSVVVIDEGQPRRIVHGSPALRFGGLHLIPERGLLLAIREDHRAKPEPRTQIVALQIAEANLDGGQVLVTGADFYAGVTHHGDSFAWFQWNHPAMSWDTASVWRASLTDPHTATAVENHPGVSATTPLFADDGTLAWISDKSGFWNWQLAGVPWECDEDCVPPTWVLDRAPAAFLGKSLASVQFVDAEGRLALWDPDQGCVHYPLGNTANIESIAAYDNSVYIIAQWRDRNATLVRLDADGAQTVLVDAPAVEDVVAPESLWSDSAAGAIHSFFYPAQRIYAPPLLVMTHGGPTSASSSAYDIAKQFWVSRGVAVLDVNYSGSTGFGRQYRQRLRGQWGVLEVADVVAAVNDVISRGLADPRKVVITGGSAGGFTTLQALVTTDLFAAGISRYGVCDLKALAHDTHKAESRYLDGLLGPLPETEQIWRDRSPIEHLDALTTPMLILQGTHDRVVPPNQAEALAYALRSKGLAVALLMFDGEGHGFRTVTARRRALEAQVSFIEQVLNLPHSSDIPVLPIENL